jgi:LCP family protein required for cell wall assembly
LKLPTEERPPREGLRFLLRAGLSSVLIVLLAAAATATAGLLKIKDEITPPKDAPPPVPNARKVIDHAPSGKPQTILILGSDKRWGDKKNLAQPNSEPARSDTIMLVRIDPKQQAIAVMSIPRDLKVLIPGFGINKINAAYSLGGAALTAQTVKQLFTTATGTDFKIHHIVNVNFRGFRQAVDALNCVYTDVDRRYYHSNVGLPPGQRWAAIDVQPGYQSLCGQRALDYVRYRHTDSDLVRGARQQDFLRAAKDQIGTSQLLDNREKLIKIMQRNTQTDPGLRDVAEVIKVAKLALYSAHKPVVQITFPPVYSGDPTTGEYVEASPETLTTLRDRFYHGSPPVKKHAASTASAPRSKTSWTAKIAHARLVNARHVGAELVRRTVHSHRLGFRLYFPRELTLQGRYPADGPTAPMPRVYTLRDRAGRPHKAYRLVVVQSEADGSYYGVQGTDWMTPPLLAHPTSTTVVRGRRLMLFKDGSRLRFVAWKRKDAVYWVSNSLGLGLSNAQMVGIAASLTHLGS